MGYTIGVDIGGTKIAAGVVDEDGSIVAQTRRATSAADSGAIEAAVVDSVRELQADHQVDGVGVAVAGFISSDRETVLFCPNLAWSNYPLAARLRESFDLPVAIENDANAAGWAEFKFGGGRGYRDMVMLTIGTGLGGAIVSDGQLVRGAFGAGAELGHMKVNFGGHYCGCGHEGCLEAYVSGTALGKAAERAVRARPDAGEGLAAHAKGKVKGKHVTEMARQGDPLSRDLLGILGHWLGVGMAIITSVTDPEIFVIGGGICAEHELFLPQARKAYLDNLSARGFRGVPEITIAQMSNDAGIVGAADSVRDSL